MCEVLRGVGLDVVGAAANVTDALCIAENTHPDLAIFDIQLQGQRDGIRRSSSSSTVQRARSIYDRKHRARHTGQGFRGWADRTRDPLGPLICPKPTLTGAAVYDQV
jgi:hypothetical protein